MVECAGQGKGGEGASVYTRDLLATAAEKRKQDGHKLLFEAIMEGREVMTDPRAP